MAMSGAALMGAEAIGSSANLVGQIMANNANRAATGKQMRWQDANIQKAMDFQREMSNTAYQRSVADMRKAGLNPMLLASKGFLPASVPSGGGTGSSSPIKQDSVTTAFMSGISSALDLARIQADTERIRAETDLKKADLPKHKAVSGAYGEVSNMWSTAKQGAGIVGKWIGNKVGSLVYPNKAEPVPYKKEAMVKGVPGKWIPSSLMR